MILSPPDQLLRHAVGDLCRVVASCDAFIPEGVQPIGNSRNLRIDRRAVCAVQLFERNIYDAACVDDVVRRIKDATRLHLIAMFRPGKLIVRAARDD